MRRYLFAVVVLTLSLLAGCGRRNEASDNTQPVVPIQPAPAVVEAKRKEPVKSDDELLPGTWKVVSVEQDGKKSSTEQPRMTKWILNGDKKAIVVRYEGDKVLGFMGYKLDPSTQPKSIDLQPTKGPAYKGIYRLQGDRLTICYDEWRIKEGRSLNGEPRKAFVSERPKEFAFSPGSGQLVIVLQRAAVSEAKADSPLTKTTLVKSRPLVTIPGPPGRISSMAFSRDGKYLATARSLPAFGADKKAGDVRIWDATNGTEVLTLRGQKSSVEALAFSPDGKRLAGACSSDRTLRVWDTKTGDIIFNLTGNKDWLTTVAFSPNGQQIAAAGGDMSVWNATTGKQLHALSVQFSKASPSVQSVAFSPDSKRLVAAVTDGSLGTVLKGWDATTGAEFKLAGNVFNVSFSPDGEQLAGSSGKKILIWNVAAGKELRSIPVDGLAFFRSDWQRFASLKQGNNILEGKFDTWSEVEVWDTAASKPLFSFGRLTPLVSSLAFSADGKLGIGSGDWFETSEVNIWDAVTLEKNAGEPAADTDPLELVKKESAPVNEAAAVKALEKLGANLIVDTSRSGKPVVNVMLSGKMITDTSLKDLKELKSLKWLTLSDTQITDAGLKELKQLKDLQTLRISYTPITEVGLNELTQLKRLQTLDLSYTKVTDAGFKRLKKLDSLQLLDLSYTPVTGVGLKELKELKYLDTLNFTGSKVTDAAFTEMKELQGLQTLRLGGTPITGAGLNHLKGLRSLHFLDLSGSDLTDVGLKDLKEQSFLTLNLSYTKTTDVGLKYLTELQSVQTLKLGNTQITDAGLKELKEIKGLQSLYLLGHAQVTDAGIAELKAARPGLNVLR
jgi:internalin A